MDQFNEKLLPIKKDFEDKKVNEYWEVLPINIPSKKQSLFQGFKSLNVGEKVKESLKETEPKNIFKIEDKPLVQAMAAANKKKEYTEPTSAPSQEHGLFFKTY